MRFMRSAFVSLCAILSPAGTGVAGERLLPALFDVVGVVEDDVLNMRAGPSAATPIVGALAPDAAGIEVIETAPGGRWGLVRNGEGAAWVAMRYLRRQPGQIDEAVPATLRCGDTEPFWSLDLDGATARFATPEGGELSLVRLWDGPPAGRPPQILGLRLEGVGSGLAAVLRREACSDGMSDIPYGLSIAVITSGAAGEGMVAGCCSLR